MLHVSRLRGRGGGFAAHRVSWLVTVVAMELSFGGLLCLVTDVMLRCGRMAVGLSCTHTKPCTDCQSYIGVRSLEAVAVN